MCNAWSFSCYTVQTTLCFIPLCPFQKKAATSDETNFTSSPTLGRGHLNSVIKLRNGNILSAWKQVFCVCWLSLLSPCPYKNKNSIFLVHERCQGQGNKEKVFGDIKFTGKNMDKKEDRSKDRGLLVGKRWCWERYGCTQKDLQNKSCWGTLWSSFLAFQ